MKEITVHVDGVTTHGTVEPRLLLVHYLRDELDATATKIGCDTGHCGSCTVEFNGKSAKSCLILAVQADDCQVNTAIGLTRETTWHPLHRLFHEHHAVQCGFCTSGMIMAARELLRVNPNPTPVEARAALKGNLCRCTGYQNIVAAVMAAASESASKTSKQRQDPFP